MFDLNEDPSFFHRPLLRNQADVAAQISREDEDDTQQNQEPSYFLSQNTIRDTQDCEAMELALSSFTSDDDKYRFPPETESPRLSFSDVSSSPHHDSDHNLAAPHELQSEIRIRGFEFPQCGDTDMIPLVRNICKGKAVETQDATRSLSLGNSLQCSARKRAKSEDAETKQLFLMPLEKVRRPDLFGLELGRSSMDADCISLSSKQFTSGLPFWSGEFRFHGWRVLRAAAYSLGLLTSDSKLKTLPNIMSVNKFVTLKELSEVLSIGFMEPVIKFVPFGNLSLEDADSFQSTVETLLEGSSLTTKDDRQLELGLGHRNSPPRSSLASYAASIYLDDLAGGVSQAELFLVAPASFQEILRIWSPNISICAVEEVDVCDHSSLYGILLCGALNNRSLENGHIKKEKLNYMERSASWPVSLPGNNIRKNFPNVNFSSEMEKKDHYLMKVTSCSRTTSHFEEVDVEEESSVVREPSQLKWAPSIHSDGLQADIGSDGKERTNCPFSESTKHFGDPKCLLNRKHEVEKGRNLARQSSLSENILDEEVNRQTQHGKERDRSGWNWRKDKDEIRSSEKQDRYSGILEQSPSRWDKDDSRGSERNRDTGHLYSHHHDNERSWKNRERVKHFDSERNWKNRERVEDFDKERARDGSSRKDDWKQGNVLEKVLEAEKNKLEVEKSSASLAENVTSCHENSSPHGNHMGKDKKKREREDDNNSYLYMSSSKEIKMSFENTPDSTQQDENYVKDLISESAKGPSVRGADEIVSAELGFKDIIEEVSATFKSDDTLFLSKEKDGVENVELDDKAIIHVINDNNKVDSHNSETVAETNVGKLHIELTSESIGITNLVSKTYSPDMDKASVPSELAVFRADVSRLLSLVKIEGSKAFCEFSLEEIEKETRSWLISKQSELYFQEEYGVLLMILGERYDSDPSPKLGHQQGSLHVRITMIISDTCDATEACWFVNQAAIMLRVVASHGVYKKCLWYEGPLQVDTWDSGPSIAAVVKKIKGENRMNLEHIQEDTGVMIGMVLKNGITTTGHEPDATNQLIGLRLKCIRRKGLLEASRKAEALLSHVADHFSKELTADITISQENGLEHSETNADEKLSSSKALVVAMHDVLPPPPTKLEDSLLGKIHLSADENVRAFAKSEEPPYKISEASCASFKEQTDAGLSIRLEGTSSTALFVSNLPEKITSPNIQDLFERVLNEKLGFSLGTNLVVAVRYLPEKYSAFIELANDAVLNEALKLYIQDKSVFSGFKVELGHPVGSKLARQTSSVHVEFGDRSYNSEGNLEELQHMKADQKRNNESYSTRRLTTVSSTESGSEYLNEQYVDEHDTSFRKAHLFEKPKPLFLTELMRNASAQTIKQLFEEIITKYISPSLVGSSGRQLVLDVRYVPSRGCAFVDLATPELVKFMLELHSQRPEVFCNMKMELGRRQVPYSLDDDSDRKLLYNRDITSSRPRSRGHVSGGSYHRYDLPPGSQRQRDRQDYDYFEESDKCEDLQRQSSFARRRRSDPERTLYADRLPECATESMIKRIFERVLSEKLTREQRDVFGNDVITEVRHVPIKFCAFVVFSAEELTRLVLQIYNKDEDIFDKMRLKPHFNSRMEDLYRETFQEPDDADIISRDRVLDYRGSHHESDDYVKAQHAENSIGRCRYAANRAIAASAFKEVDRRRSVYVDRIPEDLSEVAMKEMFEKVYRRKANGRDTHMVSQVTFFRDKFDQKKLCAFVEVRNENATRDLIEFYNAHEAAFLGMRVRPAIKYNS